jgi:hypothetical protein
VAYTHREHLRRGAQSLYNIIVSKNAVIARSGATKQSVIFDYAIRRMKHKVRESYDTDCFAEFTLRVNEGLAMTTRKEKEGYTGVELD